MELVESDLSSEEKDALETAREYASALEEALFLTFTAVVKADDDHSASLREARLARAESREAWRSLADKVFSFAVSDD